MPVFVLAIVDDHEKAATLIKAIPLKTALATMEVQEHELRTYPLETLIELNVRPVTTAVVRSWRSHK